MIVFELACVEDHRFEGWFASGESFEGQRAAGLVVCPVCASTEVTKIPHAKIARAEAFPVPAQGPPPNSVARSPGERFQAVAAFLQHVLRTTEDVGRAFPEEARRIHYEDAPQRAIRGVASAEEARELLDEGIAVLPVPIPPEDERH